MIISDPAVELVDTGQRNPPSDWASRALYTGISGESNWRRLVGDPAYVLQRSYGFRLTDVCTDCFAATPPKTLVSLGPGDGLEDFELVKSLKALEPDLQYIPVDISRKLLSAAIGNLESHVAIPVAIHADFESSRELIAETVERHGRPPILYILLGGTIGNLDRGELQFFGMMKQLMRPGDRFLHDIQLDGPGWKPSDEFLLDKSACRPALRSLLAGGLSQRGQHVAIETDWFEGRVEFSINQESDIEGTRTTVVRDRPTGQVLVRFRRYEWDRYRDWLGERGFDLEYWRSALGVSAEMLGTGVVVVGSRSKRD
jgi:hypothetical protein